MFKLLGVLLISFLFTGVLAVPFINLLYNLKFRQKKNRSTDFLGRKTLYQELHGWKVGTPVGGGILVIIAVFLFSAIYYWLTAFTINWTAIIIAITLLGFGLLGFYDDFKKMIPMEKNRIRALSSWSKFLIQISLGLTIGYLLYTRMGLSSISLPILEPLFNLGPIELGPWYIFFAAFVIIAMSNAFNITDGMDGLSTGLLLIALAAFWYLAGLSISAGDVQLSIAVLMGSLLAYLYFNIYPARIMMGDTGALAFGAMLGTVALIIGQSLVLPIIGGVFVAEVSSSLVQYASMYFRKGKKVFLIAPLHHHFEALGWEETKVTMRFWLVGAVCAFIGLFVATFGII